MEIKNGIKRKFSIPSESSKKSSIMKLAVMQPYVFPYIGYFQLIKAVDKFVFYNDVNFIKQGWINRNKILINNRDFLFTIPLKKANSFCLIKDTFVDERFYESWKRKFLRSIDQNYKKAPHFAAVINLIRDVLDQDFTTIDQLATESIVATSKFLELKTDFIISSETYNNKDLNRLDRLIDICKKEGALNYINAFGGQELYKKEDFENMGIEINFIKPQLKIYKQYNDNFVPSLSIIDVLMFNSVEEVNKMLGEFDLR